MSTLEGIPWFASELRGMRAPTHLHVSYLAHAENPTITDPDPALGWRVPEGKQSAYQVQLRRHGGETVFDTGRVTGESSQAVRCLSKGLTASGRWGFRVRVWGSDGRVSPWSVWRQFETQDAGKWPKATRENENWENRHTLQTTERSPERIVRRADGTYFADFGRSWFGMVTLNAPFDGEVGVHFGEKLAAPDTIERKPPGSVTYRKTKTSVGKGTPAPVPAPEAPFAPNVRRGQVLMPPSVANVCPFRAVELEGWQGKLSKKQLTLYAIHDPFDEKAARFESSDPLLNQIAALCRHTLHAASYCGVSVDGERERTPYEADAYIAQLGHQYSDTNAPLYRYTLEFLLEFPTWPTEWALHLPLMAEADYEATGDIGFTMRLWDKLVPKLLRNRARPDGLLEAGAIVDWPPAERDGFGSGSIATDNRQMAGPMVNVVANAFALRSLAAMERLAQAGGKSAEAATFRRDRERAYKAFLAEFLDEKQGIFTDGPRGGHAALHANLFPLAFGLVPEAHKKTVVAFIKSRGMACSVYAAHYLLDGLLAAGETDYVLSLMTAPGDRSWRHMIETGAGMTWEAWDAKYKPNLTWNHAWGAAPANLLPRYVLGVRPLEPGFTKILIAPQPGKLRSLKGQVPTYRGPVTVVWERGTITVDVPGNTRAQVIVPGSGATHEVGPGRHTFRG